VFFVFRQRGGIDASRACMAASQCVRAGQIAPIALGAQKLFSRGVLTVEKSVIRFRPKRIPSRSE
jgi:hypothetical protein